MKQAILFLLLLSTANAAEYLECTGESIYPNPKISVDKILLTFPQKELYLEHTDMRLEVVGMYTDYASRALHFWEENKDFFVYVMGDQYISFAWGSQHYGDLITEDKGNSFQGEITISKHYDFKVNCLRKSL